MRASLWLFLTGTLTFWVLASALAFLCFPEQRDYVLAYSAVAGGLCGVPCTLTLLWVLWAFRQAPDMQQLAVLGGTGVRMFLTLGVALALTSFIPYFQQFSFWLWVLVFYLFTLALEIIVVVRGQALPNDPRK